MSTFVPTACVSSGRDDGGSRRLAYVVEYCFKRSAKRTVEGAAASRRS
jgi:hypothetical protein